jgi:hypothetical protein
VEHVGAVSGFDLKKMRLVNKIFGAVDESVSVNSLFSFLDNAATITATTRIDKQQTNDEITGSPRVGETASSKPIYPGTKHCECSA